MELSLNPNGAFFFVKEAGVYLSFEQPGPIKIDWQGLDSRSKNEIITAIQRGTIISTTPLSELIEVPKLPLKAKEKPVEKAVTTAPVTVLPGDDETVSKLLHKSLAGIKKAISASKDLRVLRMARDTENNNKKRKTVIRVLDERIFHLEGLVAHSIAKTAPDLSYADTIGLTVKVTEVVDKAIKLDIKPGIQ